MKLLYIAHARLPTEKAHGLQIVKMCEAFADAGADVTLVAPARINPIDQDLFLYYRVTRNFTVRFIPVFNPSLKGGLLGFIIEWISFALSLPFSNIFKESPYDVIFTRDSIAAFLLSFQHPKVIFEMHAFPERFRWLWGIVLRRLSGVFSTNQWKMEEMHRRFKISKEKLFFYPNGFDPKLFSAEGGSASGGEITESKEELRKTLGLPKGKPIVMYTGHLYGWKGAHILARAARIISDVNMVFVGGTEKDCMQFRKEFEHIKNIYIVGHKPHYEIPKFLKSADILVLPNSAISEESRTGTSPLKLFEYMASGKPIIASDLPSIREVVSEKEVVFVRPDDPRALAQAIQGLVHDSERAARIAEAGFEKSKKYTWISRARAMLDWMVHKNTK